VPFLKMDTRQYCYRVLRHFCAALIASKCLRWLGIADSPWSYAVPYGLALLAAIGDLVIALRQRRAASARGGSDAPRE
jgi:hypothetical protein